MSLCVGCRTYLAHRDAVYAAPFRELLDRLDIDSTKDAEVVADGPLENFFVGEMLTAGENVSELCDSPYFAFWLTRHGPCPKEFRSEPRLAIEFAAHFQINAAWAVG